MGERTTSAFDTEAPHDSCAAQHTLRHHPASHPYMLGVRLLPSRAGPARDRALARPPRFRAKNFSMCTRSPAARVRATILFKRGHQPFPFTESRKAIHDISNEAWFVNRRSQTIE